MRDSIRLLLIMSLMSTPAFAAGFSDPPERLAEEPQALASFILVLALFVGLILAIVAGFNSRNSVSRRGFRGNRIRKLKTRLRAAQGDAEKSRNEIERLDKELKEKTMMLLRRDYLITEQQSKIKKIQSDLRYSIIKTRELRAELAERAVEIVHAEAKIREARTNGRSPSSPLTASKVPDWKKRVFQ